MRSGASGLARVDLELPLLRRAGLAGLVDRDDLRRQTRPETAIRTERDLRTNAACPGDHASIRIFDAFGDANVLQEASALAVVEVRQIALATVQAELLQ